MKRTDSFNLKKLRPISNDFVLAVEENTNLNFLLSEKLNLKIAVKQSGYIPRSGLLLADYLNKVEISKSALDIGTGETGLLAYYMKARGASSVVACDIDREVIVHAGRASTDHDKIRWLISDVFSAISSSSKFDIIVSNPPQMPMREPGSLHDYGGIDGREIIVKILRGAPFYLKKKGRLYLLCFDFLGIDERYNAEPAICEIAFQMGMDCNVVAEDVRYLRKGGCTEKNKSWVNQIYPRYVFEKDSVGNAYHKMQILELTCQR